MSRRIPVTLITELNSRESVGNFHDWALRPLFFEYGISVMDFVSDTWVGNSECRESKAHVRKTAMDALPELVGPIDRIDDSCKPWSPVICSYTAEGGESALRQKNSDWSTIRLTWILGSQHEFIF